MPISNLNHFIESNREHSEHWTLNMPEKRLKLVQLAIWQFSVSQVAIFSINVKTNKMKMSIHPIHQCGVSKYQSAKLF